MLTDCIVVSGSSNIPLATNIASRLHVPLAEIELSRFACSETRVRVTSDLKDKTVLLIQSTSAPANDHLVESILITDAVRRYSPKKIIGIIPWFGYAPQDKVFRTGEPLSSEVVIKMLEVAGIDSFVILDIHSSLVLDKFTKDVTHLSAMSLFEKHWKDQKIHHSKAVVATLDKGNTVRSRTFAQSLGVPLVEFEKTRDRNTGKVTFHALKGGIDGKHVVIFDDYTSTGQTLIDSAAYLKTHGAVSYTCCVTHIAVSDTIQRIEESHIDACVTTNTIHFKLPESTRKITVLDASGLIAEHVRKMAHT
jgi:ribose-phosphate pyrophosphokinase